ncbi:N-acetylmuramoyl-L-alanine amidase family protein [Chitinophaga silvisoli]|uniref:N-acetylmuramoyl-L-alanine amidase n=1 Tax=Chitinophaga silvisoli TaxID=2291814 RepID=A0A3E1NXM0_9BACT|nr:N-acetylmuramoyl-L-alanine amidase [Chitinophaga silvisoli]RFM32673.1 N-acetylmuramoyl-L-alanine amidase [Chitinophaga silvisoli]
MRWNRFWIFLCCATFFGSLFLYARNKPEPAGKKQNPPLRTIIIDPGHSATTPGAKGSFSTEEQVTLDVALKLGKLIEANMKDVRVVYTRKTPAALAGSLKADLNERANIANREKGDLFISIHCNSAGPTHKVTGYKTVMVKKGKKKVATKRPIYSTSPSTAEGTETYVWATGKNNAKTESLRESSVIMLDAESEGAGSVLDMSDPETFILLNTLRNAYFDQSLRLSSLIEDQFTEVGRISRGARQRDEKGIWVLQATAMPSVLVELGFISNPQEEKYLNSEDGQQEMALCIFKAIKKYKEELNRYDGGRSGGEQSTLQNNAATTKTKSVYKQSVAGNTSVQPGKQSFDVQLLVTEKTYGRGATIFNGMHGTIRKYSYVKDSKKLNKYIWENFRTEAEAKAALQKAKQLGFRQAFVINKDASVGSSKSTPPVQLAKTKSVSSGTDYKYNIQLLVTDKKYARSAPIFNKLNGYIKKQSVAINNKTLNKYVWGTFSSLSEARSALSRAKKAGFWNAFIMDPEQNSLAQR